MQRDVLWQQSLSVCGDGLNVNQLWGHEANLETFWFGGSFISDRKGKNQDAQQKLSFYSHRISGGPRGYLRACLEAW